MKSFVVNENDSGRRLDKYISKIADIPKGLLYKFLRTGHIKVNKKKVSGSYILCPGDTLSFFIDDVFFNDSKNNVRDFNFSLDIVFESEDILIINKPQGVKSQPDKTEDGALSEYVKSYLFKKGEFNPEEEKTFTPALCNRLDVNTSGLVIAAKNAESLRILNQKIKDREITKLYQCIVKGIPSKKEGVLEGYILKDREKNISKIVNENLPSSLPVKTSFRVIGEEKNFSLLEVKLHTGRSHQIRAHLASIGCPILGDFKYGGGNGTQKLCAFCLKFDFTSDSGRLDYLKGKVFKINPPFGLKEKNNESC